MGDGEAAVRVGAESISWAGLAHAAAATAAGFAGATAIAVQAKPVLDTVIAIVAALRAGVPIVPVPADSGPMEREHVLRDSGASLIVGAHTWDEVALPTVPVLRTGPDVATPEPGPDATGLIMYTSGTTGAPKGAVLPRRAIAACLDGLADAWGWTADDTLCHGLPLFHVHGLVLGVLGALRAGSRLIHTGRPTPAAYAAAADDGATMFFGVPTVWSRVCAEPDAARALAGARLVVSGSAALPVPVFQQMTALIGQQPVERYGMTETLITISARADGERRPGHVGVPIRGVESRLNDDNGLWIIPDGVTVGSLQIRGDTMFDGYLNRPEATAASFTSDGWFITGDAAIIGTDGVHRIVGRQSTDVIKTGGYKVGAGEVEEALLLHPGVSEAAVIGVPDDDLGQRIVAFVVATGVTGPELVQHVAAGMSVHKRPRAVHIVDQLPRNAMGKVQKTKLVEP